MPLWWIPEIDTWVIVIGALSAVSCALAGSFLVLRRMSMMGDALSHAVLPGLAAAFVLSGSRDSFAMFLGALAAGLATGFLVQFLQRLGQVEEGAAMGVVFTALFALGLVMIERAASAAHVELDPGCVLYGALETVPLDTFENWAIGGLAVPRMMVPSVAVLLLNVAFIALFWKELKVSSFDPAAAHAQGIPAGMLHHLLMALVAVTVVAAFWSVGSILVIAMLIVPGAAAMLLTRRLWSMLLLAVAIAVASAVAGHWSAVEVPAMFGLAAASTSGMMAVSAGAFFALALAASLLMQRRGARASFSPDASGSEVL